MNKLELPYIKFFFDVFLPRASDSDDNYYEILGVDDHATPKEIRQAYLDKVRTIHPNKDDPSSCTNVQECKRLYSAYEVSLKTQY
jgi:DnaJ-class molecular chaperone